MTNRLWVPKAIILSGILYFYKYMIKSNYFLKLTFSSECHIYKKNKDNLLNNEGFLNGTSL